MAPSAQLAPGGAGLPQVWLAVAALSQPDSQQRLALTIPFMSHGEDSNTLLLPLTLSPPELAREWPGENLPSTAAAEEAHLP